MYTKCFVCDREFYVWTFAYDVSEIKDVTFHYREDNDGMNPISDISNEVYHCDMKNVGPWTSKPMVHRSFPKVSRYVKTCMGS